MEKSKREKADICSPILVLSNLQSQQCEKKQCWRDNFCFCFLLESLESKIRWHPFLIFMIVKKSVDWLVTRFNIKFKVWSELQMVEKFRIDFGSTWTKFYAMNQLLTYLSINGRSIVHTSKKKQPYC